MKQSLISCSIELNDKQEIIYYQHYGTLGKNSIFDAWNKVLALLVRKGTNYNLILDYRGALFGFSTSEIDDIVKFFYCRINLLHGKKIAGITNNVQEAAIIKLIKTLKEKETYIQVQMFQTIEGAYHYLLKANNISDFE